MTKTQQPTQPVQDQKTAPVPDKAAILAALAAKKAAKSKESSSTGAPTVKNIGYALASFNETYNGDSNVEDRDIQDKAIEALLDICTVKGLGLDVSKAGSLRVVRGPGAFPATLEGYEAAMLAALIAKLNKA